MPYLCSVQSASWIRILSFGLMLAIACAILSGYAYLPDAGIDSELFDDRSTGDSEKSDTEAVDLFGTCWHSDLRTAISCSFRIPGKSNHCVGMNSTEVQTPPPETRYL